MMRSQVPRTTPSPSTTIALVPDVPWSIARTVVIYCSFERGSPAAESVGRAVAVRGPLPPHLGGVARPGLGRGGLLLGADLDTEGGQHLGDVGGDAEAGGESGRAD